MQIPPRKEIISATDSKSGVFAKKGKRLLVFNPEHDLALGVGSGPYTPPAEVLKIRKMNTLLPAKYADNGDFILSLDNITLDEASLLPHFEEFKGKNLTLVTLENLKDITGEIESVMPWGWDHALRSVLEEAGLPEKFLPASAQINKIRELSHRRTVIPIRKFIARELGTPCLNLPCEILSVEDVERFLEIHPIAYLKAPWSSSGRGIVVSDHITWKGLLEWSHGIIRHQGSLIAEAAWQRIFDFATEWVVHLGEAQFLGVSVFETSSRGKYHKNIAGSQEFLLNLIKEKVPGFSENYLKVQKKALESFIAPCYEGFIGIDMFADIHGNINPCVEVNLRLTMGHIQLPSLKVKKNVNFIS